MSAFLKFMNKEDVITDIPFFFFAIELPKKGSGKGFLDLISYYLEGFKLSWKRLIRICGDNVPYIIGSIKHSITISKEDNVKYVIHSLFSFAI